MNLQKAIEILHDILRNGTEPGYPDCDNAIKLGIEALHRCSEFRKYTPHTIYILLPGETKD